MQPSAPYHQQLAELVEESRKLVSHYKEIESAYYSKPATLDKQQRLERLTLRRNLLVRQAWVEWAEKCLQENSSGSKTKKVGIAPIYRINMVG